MRVRNLKFGSYKYSISILKSLLKALSAQSIHFAQCISEMHICKICDIYFDKNHEKNAHFSHHHPDVYLKFCTLCCKSVFFLPELKAHLKHNSYLQPNPLYDYRSLAAGKVPDQTCPFCKEVLYYKLELEEHHLKKTSAWVTRCEAS